MAKYENKDLEFFKGLTKLELVAYIIELESEVKDASDLLNNCGFYLVNGTWVDEDNPEDICICNNLDHQTLNVDCPVNMEE